MKKIKQEQITGHSIDIISFGEFLQRVPRKTSYNMEGPKNIQHYNSLVSLDADDANYQRRAVMLIEGAPIAEVAKSHLMLQCKHFHELNRSPQDILEKMAVECLENFGIPVVAVRLAPRTWLIGNPEDFALVRHKASSAMICYCENRNFIVTVSRVREEDVRKSAEALMLKAGIIDKLKF